MPTEIDNSINDTHLRKMISLRKKHSYCHERLHKRSELTQRTPYAWCTFTIRSFFLMEANYSTDKLSSEQCTYSRALHNSADRLQLPWWLRWPLRAQSSWTITVRLLYHRFSTAITLTATEATCDHYYLRTKWALDFRQHPRLRERRHQWSKTTTSRGVNFCSVIGGSNQSRRYG
jgi:hypothetical protein